MATSIDGLITGIDTTAIIEGLQAVQQKQIDLLQTRKSKVVTQQAAFSGVESRLLALQSQLGRLSRTQNNVFQTRTVSVSDESAATATADSNAPAGIYQITINALAKAHQAASQGFADSDAAVSQGELLLRVGSGAQRTIVIDEGNNTLQGLADAINAAGAGVSASIVRDSSPTTPFRLLLTSERSGADHEISITNNLAATAGDVVRPEFDLDNPVQAGQNAAVTLGSGPGAITVESETNRISNLLTGVKLELHAADAGKEISISVQRDTETGAAAVQDFVDSYNELLTFIDAQSRFNSATQTGGPLLGNRDTIDIQNTLRSALLDVVPGANPRLNRLSALGVTVTDAGRLTVNTTKMQDVLAGRVEGVSSDDVRKLFALHGTSDNPNVRFLLGSSRTKDGLTPYQVDITQAPERATITGADALAASIVIDETNDVFSLNVDGADSGELTLVHGTYAAQELATHVAAVINADEALIGRSVSVTVSGGKLQMTSAAYGSLSRIDIGSGSALAALGFDGTEADSGRDVAGTFIVNGETEPAVGRGRILSGASDNPFTADLQLQVTLTSAQIQAGSEANVTITRGLAARLDQIITSLVDSQTGRVKRVDDRFDDMVADIDASIERYQERAAAQQEALIKQFVALESAVGQLQSTSSFLASQLGAVSSLRRG